MDNKEFLESMVKHGDLCDHSIEKCGNCYFQYIMARVAKEMLDKGDINEDTRKKWSDELRKRWIESKYHKLWTEEVSKGRDPIKEFEKRGWIP